ncbi:hypothetical protein [Streptomyces prunicolor]
MGSSQGDTWVRTYTERYIERTGRDPYTDCWPWAEAVLEREWPQVREYRLGWGLEPGDLEDGDAEDLPAVIAETLRLNMARYDRLLGDLNLDTARAELWNWAWGWIHRRTNRPVPGTPRWPEPTGPYADRWRAAFLPSDPERTERLARCADNVLLGLLFDTAQRKQSAAAIYRLKTHNCDYIALADTAPLLGITEPIEASDPLSYQGIEDLTVVPARAAD